MARQPHHHKQDDGEVYPPQNPSGGSGAVGGGAPKFASPTRVALGSTRGTGFDAPRRSTFVAAQRIKHRSSSRADLLLMPDKHPDDVSTQRRGGGGAGHQAGGGQKKDKDKEEEAEEAYRLELASKPTVNLTDAEVEDLVSMGEAAYIDRKISQTVTQFKELLATPRGRVALKSQQYLHEMTNETLDAQRRLLYEVRQRTRLRAKEIFLTLVERLRLASQRSRIERWLAHDYDLYPQQHQQVQQPAPGEKSVNTNSTGDKSVHTNEDALKPMEDPLNHINESPYTKKEALYSDIDSDRGANAPYRFAGVHQDSDSEEGRRAVDATPRNLESALATAVAETPAPAAAAPADNQEFSVTFTDGTSAVLSRADVCLLFQNPEESAKVEQLQQRKIPSTLKSMPSVMRTKLAANDPDLLSNAAVSPHSVPRLDSAQASPAPDGANAADAAKSEVSSAVDAASLKPDNISQALYDAFLIAVDAEGLKYLPVRNALQLSLQRVLMFEERIWVKQELVRLAAAAADDKQAASAVQTPSGVSKAARESERKVEEPRHDKSHGKRGEAGKRVDTNYRHREKVKRPKRRKSTHPPSSRRSSQSSQISRQYSYTAVGTAGLLPHSAVTIMGLGPDREAHEEKRAMSAKSEISRLTAFYKEYFPAKVRDLPGAFETFRGKEKEMKHKVIQKYLDKARKFFTPAEVQEAMTEYHLKEKVLTQQMGLIAGVGDEESDRDSDEQEAQTFGKFAFH